LNGAYRLQENTKSRVNGAGEMWNHAAQGFLFSILKTQAQYAAIAIKAEYESKMEQATLLSRR
jgi:hypothetical protein